MPVRFSLVTFILGRQAQGSDGPTAALGYYRAADGSEAASLSLDIDRPHAALVVGKRGYGKSYTLGVFAEGLSRATSLAPVVLDPMGAFTTLDGPPEDGISATVVHDPTIVPDSLDPRSWCRLVGLSPESGAGSVLWQAAAASSTLDGMRTAIRETTASADHQRAALNHLTLAESWGIFAASGLNDTTLTGPSVTVVDLSGLERRPMNAVARAIAETLYRSRVDSTGRLPWLLVDEAHAFFDGIAAPALDQILTRGRSPGVSIVLATQRPSAVPETAVSQSDLLVSHRLTAREDLRALETAQPTYLEESLSAQLPTNPGDVLIVDDTTETVHTARIRERFTPHGGESPRASEQRIE